MKNESRSLKRKSLKSVKIINKDKKEKKDESSGILNRKIKNIIDENKEKFKYSEIIYDKLF